MARTDRVGVHLLHEIDVISGNLFGQRPARIRPERVARKTFDEDAIAVDEQALSGADLNGAESEPLTHGMRDGIAQFQPHFEFVEIRRLGSPESRIDNLSGDVDYT